MWFRTFVLLILCGLGWAQQRELKPGWNLFSKDQDIQLGKEAKAQIEKEVVVVKDAALGEYVRSIGQKLASQPQAGGYPYSFDVVHDDSINAFALPGGPTFVHTGLIAAAENEAQLAGVMAHEISHVALRHGTNQASKAGLMQLPVMLGSAMLGKRGGLLGALGELGIGLGANSLLLKYSRNAERDADLLGARMMAQAGYNPVEMARFFEKLQAEGGSRTMQFFSSHPNPGNRVKAVEQEIRYLPKREYSSEAGRLPEAQAAVKRLGPAPKKAAAAAAGQAQMPEIRVSNQYREHQGSGYAISYPDNWQVQGESNSPGVTLAPKEGIVTSQAGGAVGFGALVNYDTQRGDKMDLARNTQELIRKLQNSNPSLKPAGSQARQTRVGGEPALVTTLTSQSPFAGQTEVDVLVTVERPQGLFFIVFVAPNSQTRTLDPVFNRMLSSVRFSQ